SGEGKQYGELKVWDLATDRNEPGAAGPGREVGKDEIPYLKDFLSMRGLTRRVRAVSFSPDGYKLCCACDDGLVRVWELADGKKDVGDLDLADLMHRIIPEFPPRSLVLRGHVDKVDAIAFSADGTMVASGGRDRHVKVWDVTSEQEDLSF